MVTLRVRVLGRVPYGEALDLQRALHASRGDQWVLVLEHPPVYTLGRHADAGHVLVDPADVGAELVWTDRGGDVTWHGPGQVVVYPIVDVAAGLAAGPAHVRALEQLAIDVLATLGCPAARLDGYPGVWVDADGPNPRKIAAVGVRVERQRTMHGLALNVDTDLSYFEHIVPCGIADKAVTSLAAEGIAVPTADVADALATAAGQLWSAGGPVDRQDVAWPAARPNRRRKGPQVAGPGGPLAVEVGPGGPFAPEAGPGGPFAPEVGPVVAGHGGPAAAGPRHGQSAGAERVAPAPEDAPPATGGSHRAESAVGSHRTASATPTSASPVRWLGLRSQGEPGDRARRRLTQAGVDATTALPLASRKPPWLRTPAHMGRRFVALGRTIEDLGLATVCQEAGCPNIFECWAEGTATFMINGERCTRACGFCLVDTARPGPLDPEEPDHVAEAVERLGLSHAVVTAVARDDLPDGGAGAFAATIAAIRRRRPATTVEVLIPDLRGDRAALDTVLAAGPDVLNHNLETVARLHRAVRPSAGYARSLVVLARAKAAGLVTKSGLMVGLGETVAEVHGALADLAGVGCDIVTIGQYLRPSRQHLPVARWWSPDEIDALGEHARAVGFAHVEASPLTRSSHHAGTSLAAVRTGRSDQRTAVEVS